MVTYTTISEIYETFLNNKMILSYCFIVVYKLRRSVRVIAIAPILSTPVIQYISRSFSKAVLRTAVILVRRSSSRKTWNNRGRPLLSWFAGHPKGRLGTTGKTWNNLVFKCRSEDAYNPGSQVSLRKT